MAGVSHPRRGQIYWVNLDPTIGSEIRKKRPAVIVSNDAANRRYRQVTILPLTTQNLGSVELFQVLLLGKETGMGKDSKALAEQIRTVAKERIGKIVGAVGIEHLEAIARAIKIHLSLD